MKQIYNFEQHTPPVLTESLLREEQKKRELHRQTTMATIAGILMQVALLLIAVFLFTDYPAISLVCAGYVIISATGGTVMAIIMHSSTGRRALHQA